MYTLPQRLKAFERGYRIGRHASYQREPIPARILRPSVATEEAEAEGYAWGFSDGVMREHGETLPPRK